MNSGHYIDGCPVAYDSLHAQFEARKLALHFCRLLLPILRPLFLECRAFVYGDSAKRIAIATVVIPHADMRGRGLQRIHAHKEALASAPSIGEGGFDLGDEFPYCVSFVFGFRFHICVGLWVIHSTIYQTRFSMWPENKRVSPRVARSENII